MAKQEHEAELEHVWESWDFHLFEKMMALDHMIRRIERDMTLAKAPRELIDRILSDRLHDMTEQVKERNKDAGRFADMMLFAFKSTEHKAAIIEWAKGKQLSKQKIKRSSPKKKSSPAKPKSTETKMLS